MNLAIRDIRHSMGRFVFTTIGVGMLLMVVMGMGGIYRGLVDDALVVSRSMGADLWVVQRDTRGPFAEISRVPRNVVDRVAAVSGVKDAREFVYHTIQREHRGKSIRIAVLGLGWPIDKGENLPLVAGRPLAQNHFEMIADLELGLELGEKIKLGKDVYTVVGLTRGMVSAGGDGIGCFSSRDAQAIQFDQPGESTRLERQARRARCRPRPGPHAALVIGARVGPIPCDRRPGARRRQRRSCETRSGYRCECREPRAERVERHHRLYQRTAGRSTSEGQRRSRPTTDSPLPRTADHHLCSDHGLDHLHAHPR